MNGITPSQQSERVECPSCGHLNGAWRSVCERCRASLREPRFVGRSWMAGKFEVRVFLVALMFSGIFLSPLVYLLLNAISKTSEPAPLWVGPSFGILWSYFCMQIARGRSPYLDMQLFRKFVGMEQSKPAGSKTLRVFVFAILGLLIGAALMWLAWEAARRVIGRIYNSPVEDVAVLFPVSSY